MQLSDNFEIGKIYEIVFDDPMPKALSTNDDVATIIVWDKKITLICLGYKNNSIKFLFKNNIVYFHKDWIKNYCKAVQLLN